MQLLSKLVYLFSVMTIYVVVPFRHLTEAGFSRQGIITDVFYFM